MVTFRKQDRERVVNGEITVTYRLWKTAKVRSGKQYRTGIGTLAIDDVQVMPAAMIPKRDVRPSGCPSIAAIREHLTFRQFMERALRAALVRKEEDMP